MPATVKVLQQINTDITSTCSATMSNIQSVLCPIIAQNCSNYTVTCGTEATQSFECSDTDWPNVLASAAQHIMDNSVSLKAVANAFDIPSGRTSVDVKNAVKNSLTQSCNSPEAIAQHLQADAICEMSQNVNVSAVASANESVTCLLSAATQIMNKINTPPNPRNDKTTLYIFIGGVAVFLFLALVIFLVVRG